MAAPRQVLAFVCALAAATTLGGQGVSAVTVTAAFPGVPAADFNATAFADAVVEALVAAGTPDNASLAVGATLVGCPASVNATAGAAGANDDVNDGNDDGAGGGGGGDGSDDAVAATCGVWCTVDFDDWADDNVTTALTAGLSVAVGGSGVTVVGYAAGSVQMFFPLSMAEVNATVFGAAAREALVNASGVDPSLVVNVGVWSGSVIVQADYADAGGGATGASLSSAVAAGVVNVEYEGVKYYASYAEGNSTAPTPAPTFSPTAPTASPTRAPTLPAREVPFATKGIPLTHTKLLVATVAASVVSVSVLLVLTGTQLRLWLSGSYRTKIDAMSMRYIDYDGNNPDLPLMRDPGSPSADTGGGGAGGSGSRGGRAVATRRDYGTTDGATATRTSPASPSVQMPPVEAPSSGGLRWRTASPVAAAAVDESDYIALDSLGGGGSGGSGGYMDVSGAI